MTNSTPDERPYGERFAEAWAQLQRYLADLDSHELAGMAKSDFAETLKTLRAQPALGHSGALNKADGGNPEGLAAAIVSERLSALSESFAQGDDLAWGAEFLETWRSHSGGLSRFRYGTIQKLKAADKETAIELLLETMGRSVLLKKKLHRGTASEAARDLVTEMRTGQALFLAAIF
jgi:hypothetical protein